jgi:hypothetical protein
MKLFRSNLNSTKLAACLPVLLLASVALMSPFAANANAGKILFALGDVNVERDDLLPATRGMSVIEGDTIITGAKGRAQLKMNDGAKVSVRPSSEFKIETFTVADPIATEDADQTQSLGRVTDDGDTAVYKLLKGGFRTVTGVVGKREGDTYKVETPVATIGIRGTDFTVVLCEANCAELAGTGGAQSGVFVSVSSGHVVLGNGMGQISIFANETGFVGFGRRPVLLDVPASPIFEDLPAPPAAEQQQEGETAAVTSTTAERLAKRRSPPPSNDQDTAPQQSAETPNIAQSPSGEVDLTDGEAARTDDQISVTYVIPDSGVASLTGSRRQFSEQFALDTNGNLSEFEGFGTNGAGVQPPITGSFDIVVDTIPSTESYRYLIGSAVQRNTGVDPLTSLRWGRWSGGAMEITGSDDSTVIADLSNSSLHWVITPSFGEAVVPSVGSAEYILVGNTDPTDLNGNVGSLGSANFTADFSNGAVSNEIRLTMLGDLWVASGTGIIGGNAPNHFGGVYDSVSHGQGSDNGIGNFTGLFAPASGTANATPAGAGLTYSLQDDVGQTHISGAAVFGNPN